MEGSADTGHMNFDISLFGLPELQQGYGISRHDWMDLRWDYHSDEDSGLASASPGVSDVCSDNPESSIFETGAVDFEGLLDESLQLDCLPIGFDGNYMSHFHLEDVDSCMSDTSTLTADSGLQVKHVNSNVLPICRESEQLTNNSASLPKDDSSLSSSSSSYSSSNNEEFKDVAPSPDKCLETSTTEKKQNVVGSQYSSNKKVDAWLHTHSNNSRRFKAVRHKQRIKEYNKYSSCSFSSSPIKENKPGNARVTECLDGCISWCDLSLDEQHAAVEGLLVTIAQTLGVREQVEILSILQPGLLPITVPQELHLLSQTLVLNDYKLKQVKEYISSLDNNVGTMASTPTDSTDVSTMASTPTDSTDVSDHDIKKVRSRKPFKLINSSKGILKHVPTCDVKETTKSSSSSDLESITESSPQRSTPTLPVFETSIVQPVPRDTNTSVSTLHEETVPMCLKLKTNVNTDLIKQDTNLRSIPQQIDLPSLVPHQWDTPLLIPEQWDTPLLIPQQWDTPILIPQQWDAPSSAPLHGTSPPHCIKSPSLPLNGNKSSSTLQGCTSTTLPVPGTTPVSIKEAVLLSSTVPHEPKYQPQVFKVSVQNCYKDGENRINMGSNKISKRKYNHIVNSTNKNVHYINKEAMHRKFNLSKGPSNRHIKDTTGRRFNLNKGSPTKMFGQENANKKFYYHNKEITNNTFKQNKEFTKRRLNDSNTQIKINTKQCDKERKSESPKKLLSKDYLEMRMQTEKGYQQLLKEKRTGLFIHEEVLSVSTSIEQSLVDTDPDTDSIDIMD